MLSDMICVLLRRAERWHLHRMSHLLNSGGPSNTNRSAGTQSRNFVPRWMLPGGPTAVCSRQVKGSRVGLPLQVCPGLWAERFFCAPIVHRILHTL